VVGTGVEGGAVITRELLSSDDDIPNGRRGSTPKSKAERLGGHDKLIDI
jgi:hypothetical protein